MYREIHKWLNLDIKDWLIEKWKIYHKYYVSDKKITVTVIQAERDNSAWWTVRDGQCVCRQRPEALFHWSPSRHVQGQVDCIRGKYFEKVECSRISSINKASVYQRSSPKLKQVDLQPIMREETMWFHVENRFGFTQCPCWPFHHSVHYRRRRQHGHSNAF